MPLQDRRASVDVNANKTLVDTDSGNVLNIVADAKTITLPAAAAGKVVTVRVGGVAAAAGLAGTGTNKSAGVTIARASTDTITGLGVAGTGVTLAKAASTVGDEITLHGVAGGWLVAKSFGSWVVA